MSWNDTVYYFSNEAFESSRNPTSEMNAPNVVVVILLKIAELELYNKEEWKFIVQAMHRVSKEVLTGTYEGSFSIFL